MDSIRRNRPWPSAADGHDLLQGLGGIGAAGHVEAVEMHLLCALVEPRGEPWGGRHQRRENDSENWKMWHQHQQMNDRKMMGTWNVPWNIMKSDGT